jgi:hypothetical protein
MLCRVHTLLNWRNQVLCANQALQELLGFGSTPFQHKVFTLTGWKLLLFQQHVASGTNHAIYFLLKIIELQD